MKLRKFLTMILGGAMLCLVIWGCTKKKSSTSSGSVAASSYTLTIKGFTGGSVAISSGTGSNIPNDSGAAIDTITDFSTTTVANVTLTETPGSSYSFAGWSGGGCSGTLPTCTVKMNANQTVSVSFSSSSHGNKTFFTSGNFTVPSGVTLITVQAWGGGGGGNSYDGCGGGAGGYVDGTLPVSPGAVYNITVGVGGIGTISNVNQAGGSGSLSSFGQSGIFTAGGGVGGYTSGGNGGIAHGGTTNDTGGDGSVPYGGGGTGGSAPGFANGLGNGLGGAGGSSGAATCTSGGAGGPPGGGGGGGGYASGNNTSCAGGNGANGQVFISW
jgi:hypothetical protein